MNIFVLDLDPKKCAEYHCDKHVVKMILETAQLLCAAKWVSGESAPYKLTHKHHPCTKWACESLENWLWLKGLGVELCKEYTKRYGRTHKTEGVITPLNPPSIPSKGITPRPQAMPLEYKQMDVVKAYRGYYANHKRGILTYKYGDVPYWIEEMVTCVYQ